MPQTFRSKPRPAAKALKPQRLSSHERGYDGKWRRYSEAFRRKNPFCAFCLQRGRMTLVVLGNTGVVDHKWPVEDGGPMWARNNHHSLCHADHNGLKRLLENHARDTGQLDQLILWCDDPAARPKLRGDVPCAAAVPAPNRSTS